MPAAAAVAVGRFADDRQSYPAWMPENDRHKMLWLVRAAAMAEGSYVTVDGHDHTDAVRSAQVSMLRAVKPRRHPRASGGAA